MSGGFQTVVTTQPAPAVAGDFASANPRASVLAGPGGLVAGPLGATIGLFGWLAYNQLDADGAPAQVNNFGAGPVGGFVHREQQGLITTYLSDAGMVIPAGFNMAMMASGDYWVVNNGTGEAEVGQKAFAALASGKASFSAAGTIPGGASATGSSIAAGTFSVTGSVTGDVMTVTAVGSGTVVIGGSVSGTGIPTAPAPQVVSQLTGTTGGVGTYLLSVGEITAASETISGTYGILTIGTATGTFVVGDILTGSGVVAGTAITANLTGSGGTGGTMVANNNTVVNSTTITASTAVETKWIAMSTGLPGELVKISSQPLG